MFNFLSFLGLHVEGFSGLLGFNDEEDDEQQAMDDWKLDREAKRSREREREQADLLEKESGIKFAI